MAYITIAVPNTIDLVTTAKEVSRSLDPDVGGYNAFTLLATDANGVEYAVYGTTVTDNFATNLPNLLQSPETLVQSINSDINLRWVGEPEVTLAQISVFTQQVKVSYLYGIQSGLAELGLTLA